MQQQAERVVIGMDPHKRSATIEMMTADETIIGGGRYATGEAGFAAMRRYVNAIQPDPERRVWAIEGCNGIGHHIALRLLAAGEQVVDVPPKLSARARVVATGRCRKTDATDAHSVALVGTRMAGLRPVVDDEQLAVLRVLVDWRRSPCWRSSCGHRSVPGSDQFGGDPAPGLPRGVLWADGCEKPLGLGGGQVAFAPPGISSSNRACNWSDMFRTNGGLPV